MVGLLFETDIRPIAAMTSLVEAPCSLRRDQLVDRIVGMNPTASPTFLLGFNEDRLEEYLSHLQTAAEPRGSRWVRQASSPAIVWHESPAE